MSKRKIDDSSEKPADHEEEPQAKIAPIFLNAAAKIQHGNWIIQAEQLMIYTTQGIQHRPKIASFDLDGTLIKTKSGNVFPTNADDWQFWSRAVVDKLRKHHDNGFKLCIFTNQKGIQKKHVNADDFKKKVQNICSAIGAPIQVFISIGTPNYRKPYIGMWKRMEESENGNVQIQRSESFYVGDAAGRTKSNVRDKADHSCADRLFAHNLNLRFYTPEQFFLGKPQEEPFHLPTFNPAQLLKNSTMGEKLDPADSKVPGPSHPELLVSVGPPACGKSTFARKNCAKHYTIVTQDELGTWKACLDAAKKALTNGRSAIIDNTNRDPETRKRYCDLAATLKVPCRCLLFECTPAHAQHNNIFRKIVNPDDATHNKVNELAIRTFYSKYKEPTKDEGFSQVIRVKFIPEFENEEHRHIYGLYLTEKIEKKT